MIDEPTKGKFLKELEKSGNVYYACQKSGIHRSTHYRWLASDKEYKKLAQRAVHDGRANNADISEHMLMKKIMEGNMDAIKYGLSHNSPRYKLKKVHNILEYRIPAKILPETRTLEDLFDEANESVARNKPTD